MQEQSPDCDIPPIVTTSHREKMREQSPDFD